MKKSSWTTKDIVQVGIIMALYVVLTVAVAPLSYGNVQFRFSEILILLCFYNKKYNWSLIIGCMIANIFSPLGIIDVCFGTLATFLTCFCMNKSKNIWIASIFASLWNGLIVGAELSIFYEIPFFLTMLQVILGEFVVVTIVGCPLWLLLTSNKRIANLIDNNRK